MESEPQTELSANRKRREAALSYTLWAAQCFECQKDFDDEKYEPYDGRYFHPSCIPAYIARIKAIKAMGDAEVQASLELIGFRVH
mgnify:CR=1 FL=1